MLKAVLVKGCRKFWPCSLCFIGAFNKDGTCWITVGTTFSAMRQWSTKEKLFLRRWHRLQFSMLMNTIQDTPTTLSAPLTIICRKHLAQLERHAETERDKCASNRSSVESSGEDWRELMLVSSHQVWIWKLQSSSSNLIFCQRCQTHLCFGPHQNNKCPQQASCGRIYW